MLTLLARLAVLVFEAFDGTGRLPIPNPMALPYWLQ